MVGLSLEYKHELGKVEIVHCFPSHKRTSTTNFKSNCRGELEEREGRREGEMERGERENKRRGCINGRVDRTG